MLVNTQYIWQYGGFDDGIGICTGETGWTKLDDYKSKICETAYLNGENQATSNGGEYQYRDLQKSVPYYYVIDFGFVSDKIPLRKLTREPRGLKI